MQQSFVRRTTDAHRCCGQGGHAEPATRPTHREESGNLPHGMSNASEIPDQVSELIDLSKQYLRQETIEPAKRLGRVAGMGMAAALLFAIGALLLAVAGTRLLIRVLPEGDLWSALGLFIAVVVLAGIAGLIMWRASRDG